MQPNQTLCLTDVQRVLTGTFAGDLHAKRVLSLANATLGVVRTASLAVHTIGQGLALARGLSTKHAIKQVDRMLSNEGIDVDAALRHWVPYAVGSRTSINVAMDWTDFDADGQATLMLSLLTPHGRATPLLWLTVATASLKNHRNEYDEPRREPRRLQLLREAHTASWVLGLRRMERSSRLHYMVMRFAHVLVALVVVAVTMSPLDLRATPMPDGMVRIAFHQPCQNCPQPHQTGSMNPDKMPACPAFLCLGAVAMLPAPVLLPERTALLAVYLMTPPARWIAAPRAPDPFPPRPIALV